MPYAVHWVEGGSKVQVMHAGMLHPLSDSNPEHAAEITSKGLDLVPYSQQIMTAKLYPYGVKLRQQGNCYSAHAFQQYQINKRVHIIHKGLVDRTYACRACRCELPKGLPASQVVVQCSELCNTRAF